MTLLQQWMRRKSAADVAEDVEGGAHKLKRTLGAFDLTLLGIGAIIGAGLFSSIKEMIVGRFNPDGTLAMVGAGPAVSISFLLTALACGFAALCYAEISAMHPVSGSAYSYSYAAFGELVAWIIGWDLIIEYAIGNVYVAQSWADYFQRFLSGISDGTLRMPAWMTLDFQSATNLVHGAQATLAQAAMSAEQLLALKLAAPAPELVESARTTLAEWASIPHLTLPWYGDAIVSMNAPAMGITLLLTLLLFIGVKESARANAIMVFLKVGLVLAFIGIGSWTIWHRGTNYWTPFKPNGYRGIWQGAALGFFSYIGFDAVSTAGEECKNPQRDLPRGLIGSLLICTVLYILVAAVLTGVVPWSDLKSNDPLAYAMQQMGFQKLATLFAFGAVVAMTAVLLVFQYGQTRIFMVMSRDGLLPSAFSRVHARFQTPHISTWVTGMVVALSCSLLTPDQAIGLCNIGTLFAFILVSLGVIALRRRDPDRPRPFRVPGYPVTPILSALACFGLILGLEATNWWRLLIWLAVGLTVYFGYGIRHSRLAARGRS